MVPDQHLVDRLDRLFGTWTATRAGRLLGVNPRTVQRWIANSNPMRYDHIPEDLSVFLDKQIDLAEAAHSQERIRALVKELSEAGVHPEVIAAHLANAYRGLTSADIE